MKHAINVLGQEYEVSEQAKYTYYAGLVAMLAPLLMGVYKKGLKSVQPQTVIIAFVMLAFSTYVTNCVVRGGCDTYAWFLTAMAVITTFMLLVRMFTKKR